jgi:hypothetical protein
LKARPIWLPFLCGEPVSCNVTKHAKPVPAIDVAAPAVPWCGECQP